MQYLVAGLVTGGLYAIVASTLALTYAASGILNFAYAAEAYFSARTFYFLNTQHGWGIISAGVLSVLVISPLIGLVLWATVFRSLRNAPVVVRVVATIGLSVALVAIAAIAYGNEPGGLVPGLASAPVGTVKMFGAAIDYNQLITLCCVAGIGLVAWSVLRFTDAGLVLRAIVDSEALTKASGTNPTVAAAAMWLTTTAVTGLTGILVAPTVGLSSANFTLVMAAAFAGVIAARLQNVGTAIAVGLAIGVIGSYATKYIPATSVWASAATTSIPFAVAFLFVLYYMSRGQAGDSSLVGGILDRAVAVAGQGTESQKRIRRAAGEREQGPVGAVLMGDSGPPKARNRRTGLGLWQRTRSLQWLAGVACIVMSFAYLLSNFWVGLIGGGLALAVALLSYTAVTGQGGVISLAQITLAGVGAVTTGQLDPHVPVVFAVFIGGVVAIPFGAALAIITARIGDLYIALMTLMFGVLMDNLVFSMNRFANYSAGVTVSMPTWLSGPREFVVGMLVIYVLLALLVENLARSTAGLALAAVRSSALGAQSLGISVILMRIVSLSAGAFIAGTAGGLLAMYAGAAAPVNFPTTLGLVWLAVIVSLGVRSLSQAIAAGVSYTVLPAVFGTYLPHSWSEVPVAMFGLAAVAVAQHPEGIALMHAQQLRSLAKVIGEKRSRAPQAVRS